MSYNHPIHARDNRALPIGHRRSHFINYKGRGIYLVTLCTENRRPLLGDLCGDSPDSAYIRPTALGKATATVTSKAKNIRFLGEFPFPRLAAALATAGTLAAAIP